MHRWHGCSPGGSPGTALLVRKRACDPSNHPYLGGRGVRGGHSALPAAPLARHPSCGTGDGIHPTRHVSVVGASSWGRHPLGCSPAQGTAHPGSGMRSIEHALPRWSGRDRWGRHPLGGSPGPASLVRNRGCDRSPTPFISRLIPWHGTACPESGMRSIPNGASPGRLSTMGMPHRCGQRRPNVYWVE